LLFSLISGLVIAYYFTYRSQKPLREAVEKQRRFIADASHEIRTPLTLIKSGAEVLLRNKQATKEDYLMFTQNTILDIDKLHTLTTRLLALSRLE
jgi:two-component system, OmpR family, sensor histidine kinase CiaH